MSDCRRPHQDYERMKKAAAQIREQPLRAECSDLVNLAGNILKYLTDNPEKITAARRYIDYYQETAANSSGTLYRTEKDRTVYL